MASSRPLLVFALALVALTGACDCDKLVLPLPPPECDENGNGCLSDERCVEGTCIKFDKCESDEDCPSIAWRCTFPSQVCELRPGFDEECLSGDECEPGFWCALGKCRVIAEGRQCARRSDCPIGQACDRQAFLCIEEADCRLADAYPEASCDPGEVCEQFSGRCRLPCQNECTVATEEEDCGIDRCDGSCRCVQCLSDDDCGPGLLCNQRAGRCESEDLCYTDQDCDSPLVCDPRTALCQVPPPPCETDLDCELAEICNRATGVCETPGGECIDDRFENADTPATAEDVHQVTNNGVPYLLDDLQLCPDDDDVYAVSLSAGDNLIVRVFGTTAQARATVWLLDPEGETSLRFAMAPPFGNGTLSYVAQTDETVFVRVNALAAQSPYDMELVILSGTPCQPDPFEGPGFNNTPETATPAAQVPTGVTLVGSLCPSDKDYLRVDLLAGEGLDASLDFNEAVADFDLFLYDANTGALLASSSGVRSPESLRYRTFVDRSVIIGLLPFGASDGQWQLSLERLPKFSCEPDALEPDNVAADAVPVPQETSLVGLSRTLCSGDSDFYEVPLLDFEKLVAVATFSDADLDLEMRVLAQNGEVLRVSPNSSGGETITYAPSSDETVFLEVRSLFNARGPYVLDLFRENKLSCAPDELEPNNTVSTAAPAPIGPAQLTLCGSDQDYFSVQGVAGKQLRARAAFIHADGDLDVMIIGPDGSQLLAVSDGIGNVEEAEAVLPVDGVYTVRVFSLTNGARSRYTLEVELTNE